jgi:electron transfer flavoprotein alpha subunit
MQVADRPGGLAELYIACGISGAIQHKVGMARRHDRRDQQGRARADHEFADISVIGDALTIVPKLTEALQARRG